MVCPVYDRLDKILIQLAPGVDRRCEMSYTVFSAKIISLARLTSVDIEHSVGFASISCVQRVCRGDDMYPLVYHRCPPVAVLLGLPLEMDLDTRIYHGGTDRKCVDVRDRTVYRHVRAIADRVIAIGRCSCSGHQTRKEFRFVKLGIITSDRLMGQVDGAIKELDVLVLYGSSQCILDLSRRCAEYDFGAPFLGICHSSFKCLTVSAIFISDSLYSPAKRVLQSEPAPFMIGSPSCVFDITVI